MTATVDRFLICLPFTLAMECPDPTNWSDPANFSNDKNDPGGKTFCGITESELDIWRTQHGEPTIDVRNLSQIEGYQIYDTNYWGWEGKCQDLPAGLDLSVFDSIVNQGATGATKTLQASLPGLDVDGMWGPLTDDAIADISNVPAAIKSFTLAREAYYRRLALFPDFGHGWINRTLAISQDSLSMTGTNGRGIRIHRTYVPTIRAY